MEKHWLHDRTPANSEGVNSNNDNNNDRNSSQMFFKTDVSKSFANLWCSLFLIKWQAFRPVTLLKRDSNTGVFVKFLRTFFYRTPPVAASVLIKLSIVCSPYRLLRINKNRGSCPEINIV